MGKKRKTATRSKSQERLRRQRRRRWLIRLAGGLLGVGALFIAVKSLATPNERPAAMGTPIPVQPANHVPQGQAPGPYNTDPPTSGTHYASEMTPGFYPPEALQDGPAYPEGYLVHNLEHGYVIFWYNCAALEGDSCEGLQESIREVMAKANNFKVIAYPRPTLEVPVALSSWGRVLYMPTFDAEQALAFVQSNRNRAPEPTAP